MDGNLGQVSQVHVQQHRPQIQDAVIFLAEQAQQMFHEGLQVRNVFVFPESLGVVLCHVQQDADDGAQYVVRCVQGLGQGHVFNDLADGPEAFHVHESGSPFMQ